MLPVRWIIIVFCLVFFGCTSALVKRGDTYAELGQWVQAVDAYARAHEVRPNGADVETKLREAREEAVSQEVKRATAALNADSLKLAWTHAAKAARVHPNDRRVKDIRKKIRDDAANRVRQFVAAEDWGSSYQIWNLLNRHDSGAVLVETLAKEIAAAMIERAETLQHSLRFWESRDLLLELGRRQPAFAREVEIRVDDLKKKWIIGMRNQSIADERAGQLASAFIRASVTAGLSNHRDDHQRRQRLQALFLRQNGVLIGTQIVGESVRTRRMIANLDRVLSWKQVVRWVPRARRAELGGKIVLERPVFNHTFSLRTASQSYVAGYENVPNPEFQKRRESIQLFGSRLDQTGRMIGSLEGEFSLYESESTQLEANQPIERRLLEKARADLANASLDMSRAKEALRESQLAESASRREQQERERLDAEVQTLQEKRATFEGQEAAPNPDTSEVQTLTDALKTALEARALLNSPDPIREALALRMAELKTVADVAAQVIRGHELRVNEVEDALEAHEGRLRTCVDEQRAVRQELNDLIEEYSGMSVEYTHLITSFLRTPETITRDIKELFHYEIRDWMRSCEVRADMSGVRPTQRDMQQSLSAVSASKDSSNPPHRKYGVAGDSLRYPQTNAQLIDNADQILQARIRDWLKLVLTVVRGERLGRAQRSIGIDDEAAAADFLIAWMLSSRQPPAGFDAFLQDSFGKMDLGWLEVRGH